MHNPEKYLHYNEEDFARDIFFRSWVLAPDEKNTTFWTNWILQHPDKAPVLENARWQMLQLTVEEEVIAKERLDAIWHNIQSRKAAIQEKEEVIPEPDFYPEASAKVIPLFSFKAWQQIAAIFLIVSFCAGTLYYYLRPANLPSQTVSTAYGEIKAVILPDNSKVILNGNSTLTFPESWPEDKDREVSLVGEAYFSVTHTQNHRPFRVRLNDGVQVNVLGTKFTVTRRPTKTQVVLNEGKVKLTKEADKYYGLRTTVLDEAIMQPGDLVEVQKKSPLFNKTAIPDPQVYAAFTQNKIIFKNTLLSEVARVLEDTYGYRVEIARPGLAHKHFSGTTPTSDIDMLFSAIERLFSVQVIQKEKNIIIK